MDFVEVDDAAPTAADDATVSDADLATCVRVLQQQTGRPGSDIGAQLRSRSGLEISVL